MTSGTVQLGVGAKFDRFLSNIQLTESQLNDAKTKHEGVRRTLHDHYYDSGYYWNTSILVGSYGKNTAVRPPSDIDILFIMPASLFSRYDSYSGNGQSWLLQDVKKVLQKKYPRTDVSGDGQVVVVPFLSYGVEVVPAFASLAFEDQYRTPNTHSGGSWKYTNPKAEKTAITVSNALSKGKTVHLVKMIKVWKRYCNVPVSGLATELLVVPFLRQWPHRDKTTVYYDWMVRDFFAYMIQRRNGSETIPGISETYYFGDAWFSHAQTAYERAKKACKYEADDMPYTAKAEWKKIFGDFWVG